MSCPNRAYPYFREISHGTAWQDIIGVSCIKWNYPSNLKPNKFWFP